jgi:hypothetical protein
LSLHLQVTSASTSDSFKWVSKAEVQEVSAEILYIDCRRPGYNGRRIIQEKLGEIIWSQLPIQGSAINISQNASNTSKTSAAAAAGAGN